MHQDVHRYLDGEIEREALDASAQSDLREWEAVNGLIAMKRGEEAPAHLLNAVMSALPSPKESHMGRVTAWLLTPRPFRIAPLGPLAMSAAAVALLLWRLPLASPGAAPASAPVPSSGVTAVAARPTQQTVVYVQFAFDAKGAQSVAVAGDFNSWSTDSGMLRDADGDGVWVGMIPVEAGVHKYMFVVNGSEWITDPGAEGYAEDGFGMRNAVLSILPPAGRTT